MSSALDLINAAASAISADSSLDSWVKTNIRASGLTVKKGFFAFTDIRDEWNPGVFIIAGNERRNDDAQTWEVDIAVTCYAINTPAAPAKAQEWIIQLADKVSAIFLTAPNNTLSGKAVHVEPVSIAADAASAFPKLFRTVILKATFER